MAEPKQERALKTRGEILRAAAVAFDELGYKGASMREITKRAGVTLGAVYFHFSSKEELAREIINNQPTLIRPDVSGQGLQGAVDISLAWAQQVLENPIALAGARLVMDQEYFMPPESNSHRQFAKLFADQLQIAKHKRELRAGTDVELYARLLVSACTGLQMYAQMETGRADLPKWFEEMWQCLLPGLAVPSVQKTIDYSAERMRNQR
ncbi:ScbR family autoregulator-binding transcription factor [Streptomyces sp. NPDC059009]|uniref:ScbR family autoregulator-binding transcription factor n=1 Tax=Streptomyces sp. NPDC059009 TaxID=3346694 RepID=UPI0036C0FF80